MKTLPLVLAALVAVSLSGCFGGSPHTAVLLSCRATDVTTGAAVPMPLSFSVDLASPSAKPFAGKVANTTLANPATDRGNSYCAILGVPQEFDRKAVIQTYNATSFAELVGPPVVGMRFSAFNYNATMTAVTPQMVTFRLDPRDGERLEVRQYGLALVYSSDGDELVQTLEPIVGLTFRILQPNQIALPLPVGSYRSLEARDGFLRFGYVASTDAALLDRVLDVEVTVLEVQREVLAATPGLYGARISPQVLGDVTPFLGGRLTESAPAPAPAHADDGHGH